MITLYIAHFYGKKPLITIKQVNEIAGGRYYVYPRSTLVHSAPMESKTEFASTDFHRAKNALFKYWAGVADRLREQQEAAERNVWEAQTYRIHDVYDPLEPEDEE